MITVGDVARKLKLEAVTEISSQPGSVAAGYASDLLSCAMSRAKKDYVWVTLQSHINVVAVASLLGLAGVIVTEGNRPDEETVARANEEGVTLMLTPKTTYAVVSELAALGVPGDPEQH